MKIVILIAVMAFGLGQAVAKDLGPDEILLDSEAIVMPVGRILLINRNDFVAGVKFIKNEERTDGRYSKYDYFEYRKGGGFRKIRSGEISYKNIKWNWWNTIRYKVLWFHPNPYNFADKIEFEMFQLFVIVAYNHSAIYFWSKAHVVDEKVRLAPTPWKEVSEIDLNDKRIEWFKYDKTRGKRTIQVDKLW